MSIGRQRAKTQVPFSHEPLKEILSTGLAPILAPTIPLNSIGKCRKSSSGQFDDDGELAHAVYNATEWEEGFSDELLLMSAAEGDKAAMHILFARHRAAVFRFIQRIVRNPVIAEDLVSLVFLDVWRSANRFESRSRVTTWLLQIARFKAIGFLRQRTYQNIDRDDVAGIADDRDTPEAALDRKETNSILHTCINKLSQAHREIIDLFYFRDKSVAEISEIIGIPRATVKSRTFFARKHLVKILLSDGFDVATARASADASLTRNDPGDRP
jgi:RNA polymerase sigma-70 factor (ECF subfamily)